MILRFLWERMVELEGAESGIGFAVTSGIVVKTSGRMVAMVAIKLGNFLSHQYGIWKSVIPRKIYIKERKVRKFKKNYEKSIGKVEKS